MSSSLSRKRDLVRGVFRRSTPHAPPASKATPASRTSTPSSSVLSSHTAALIEPGQRILDLALQTLTPEEQATIRKHIAVGTRDVCAAVDDAYQAAVGHKQICEDKRWCWNFRGRDVVLRDEAEKVLLWLGRFKSIGDVAANVDPLHAGLPWAGIRMILEVTASESRQMAALLTGMDLALCMANRLKVYFEYFMQLPPTLATTNFENALIKTYAHILQFVATAVQTYQKNLATRTWQALWKTSNLENFEEESDKLELRAETEANNCDRILQAQRWDNAMQWKNNFDDALRKLDQIRGVQGAIDTLTDKVELSKLMTAAGATYNSYAEGDLLYCLEGTRTQLLEQVANWSVDPNSKHIFWLCGMAGTGKSTISRTVAHYLSRQNLLGASFFFKRGEGDRRNASRFFPTIATQLADILPDFSRYVAKAIDADSLLCERNLQEQFEKLLLQPMVNLAQGSANARLLIIVVDALDECERDSDIRWILALLARVPATTSLGLRVFVTSRPELPIKLGFRDIEGHLHHDIVLEEVQAATIEHDIRAYFDFRFKQIKQNRSLVTYDPLPTDWPGEDNIQALVNLAVPLFIFAFTVCRYISDSRPQERLEQVLQQREYRSLDGLEKTYIPILDQLLVGQNARNQDRIIDNFRQLVGPIVLVADPLSARSLSSLLGIALGEIGERLKHLHSVLDIPFDPDRRIRLFHLSFRDFLVDPDEKDTNRFWIDERETHGKLADLCIQRLSQPGTLRQDLLGVQKVGIRRTEVSKQQITDLITTDVTYTCCYWVWHLMESEEVICDDGPVHKFLKSHFLHWLEALSWLGRLSSVVAFIGSLRSAVRADEGAELISFLDDARRFVLQNRHVVGLAPLQLYCSAIVFTPVQSIIRSIFQNSCLSVLGVLPKVPQSWSSEIQKLEGHDGEVTTVVFSPDGQTIASASEDRTVRLWNATTGEERQTLEGHDKSVTAVAFSPDGRTIASASEDRTVRLWNATTGEERQKLEGHYGGVTAVAFSPDGRTIVSASWDQTVRLWNATTGEESCMIGGVDDVSLLEFAKDGRSLKTDRGTFEVDLSPASPTAGDSPHTANLELRREWVRYRDEDILWLPHEYRGRYSASHGNRLVIGQASGVISIFGSS